jgi:hypothetical protein
LQNLDAGSRLTDLENGSCTGGGRAAVVVEAIQKPVATFYQGNGEVALII